ncbi:MAG: hypothetical protein HYS13_01070 [Planctomycetia bacterium]|nr:hypothetical protein [Planctomycetia bacterium]
MSYGQSPQPGFPGNQPGQFGFPPAEPPPKKSWKGCIITILVVGGVLLGGCCLAGWLGWGWIKGKMGEVVAEQVKDSPVIQEHIGEIESCDYDVTETARVTEEAQKQGEKVAQKMVFDVKGSKGSGKLIVDVEAIGAQPDPDTAKLKLPDGRTLDVFPKEDAAEPPKE